MASPLFSAAWWLPALRRGEVSPDDVLTALGYWAQEHRMETSGGQTLSGVLELLRATRGTEMRLIQASVGAHTELPRGADLVWGVGISGSSAVLPGIASLVERSGGEAIALGEPIGRPDGLFATSSLLTATAIAPQVVLWRLTSCEGVLPPAANAGPRAALAKLRDAETGALRRLQNTPPNVVSQQVEEDMRNALIDIDEALLISEAAPYPPSVDGRYLQLLQAADHVEAIIEIACHYAQHTEATLSPLRRIVQQARGSAWNEWSYRPTD